MYKLVGFKHLYRSNFLIRISPNTIRPISILISKQAKQCALCNFKTSQMFKKSFETNISNVILCSSIFIVEFNNIKGKLQSVEQLL